MNFRVHLGGGPIGEPEEDEVGDRREGLHSGGAPQRGVHAVAFRGALRDPPSLIVLARARSDRRRRW